MKGERVTRRKGWWVEKCRLCAKTGW